ncbi:hypothetical protein V1520DRAFT_343435 [Lipomyces starkeyi]|uniref:Uncharacterized protein n=1 Tax=Lipomyces starkeyi NRRL Y-11557 TaxID=675824 RepID=A0A1E3PU20_LIPST|nr:hypothetical protein LIPSTDRAFT_76550 [Lipomyces starkeyi NRRL Y-11557]
MDDLPSSPEFLHARHRYKSSDSAVLKPSAADSLPSSPYWTLRNARGASNSPVRSNGSSDRLSVHSSSPLRRIKSSYLKSSPEQKPLSRVNSTQSLRSSTRRGALQEDCDPESDQDDRTITADALKIGRTKPRNFSTETVTDSNARLKEEEQDDGSIWEAVEDLRSRVVKLEMSDRERRSHAAILESTMASSTTSLDLLSSSSRTSTAALSMLSVTQGHLRMALDSARETVPDDVYQCLETAVADIDYLANKLPADRAVKLKVETLYRTLAELSMILYENPYFNEDSSVSQPYSRQHQRGRSTPSIAIRSDPNPVPDTESDITSRLPVRAASRMRSSLEISQLPPQLRPASRLASRSDTLHGDEYRPTTAFDWSATLNRRRTVTGTTMASRPISRVAMPRSLFPRDEVAYRPQSVIGMRASVSTGRQSGMIMSSPPNISRGTDRVD